MDLNFSTGVQTYNINGRCEVEFNPSDGTFLEKLENIYTSMQAKQDEYNAELEQVRGKMETFEVAKKRDAEMRDLLNGLFGKDVCTPVFGTLNVYALGDGMPLWMNFLMAIMDECDKYIDDENEKLAPRVKKYTDKYSKKYHR